MGTLRRVASGARTLEYQEMNLSWRRTLSLCLTSTNSVCPAELFYGLWNSSEQLGLVNRFSQSSNEAGEVDGHKDGIEEWNFHWPWGMQLLDGLVHVQCCREQPPLLVSLLLRMQSSSHSGLCYIAVSKSHKTSILGRSRLKSKCSELRILARVARSRSECLPLGEWWSQLTSTPCIPSMLNHLRIQPLSDSNGQ